MNLEQAVDLARRFHAGATDKAGKPYIEHVLRVAEAVESPDEKLAALMHDLLEDTVLTTTDLRCAGCPHRIVVAVEALTRRADESYSEFVIRASQDRIARVVKLADLADNSDERRLGMLEPALAERLRIKYSEARGQLESAIALDDEQREADWAEERGVPPGAAGLGVEAGEELAFATFWCALEGCGRPAGTVTLVRRAEPGLVNKSAHGLTVDTFLGQLSLGLSSSGVTGIQDALEGADAEALARHDWELVPFWCGRCKQSYCSEHWTTWPVFDDGFFDCTKGMCPKGHQTTLWD
jgi:hypothetical protein